MVVWSSVGSHKIHLYLCGLRAKRVTIIAISVALMKKCSASTIIVPRNIKTFLLCYLCLLNYAHPCWRSIYIWSDKWLAIKWPLWFLPCGQMVMAGMRQSRDFGDAVWSLQRGAEKCPLLWRPAAQAASISPSWSLVLYKKYPLLTVKLGS